MRNTLQHHYGKRVLSSMLVRDGKAHVGNSTFKVTAAVLDYSVIKGWNGTGGILDMQIPSFFFSPTEDGVFTCSSYERLQVADVDLIRHYNPLIDGESQGAFYWESEGHKNLEKPLFTADIFAYGGKHERCIEVWMIDGEQIIDENMANELLKWHGYSYNEVGLKCISSKFILSQDQNIEPSKFMQLCRANAVNKICKPK